MSQPSVQLKFLIKYKQINLCVAAAAAVAGKILLLLLLLVVIIFYSSLLLSLLHLNLFGSVALTFRHYVALHIGLCATTTTTGQNESTYMSQKHCAILFHAQTHK